MAQLGLTGAAKALSHCLELGGSTLPSTDGPAPRAKRKLLAATIRATPAQELVPSRKSRRIRGAPVDTAFTTERQTAEDDGAAAAPRGAFSLSLVNGRPRLSGPRANVYHHTVAGSFYLVSIGVTIHDIGHIHRGPFAQRYWSRKGCLYHHPYPVGFKAQKYHFGRSFSMSIFPGVTGPVFRVQDEATGRFWDGDSPTWPWTEACLVSKSPGTRISGPLFFGFSDPVTQKAISCMMNDEELRAARGECSHPSPNPSKEELVSRRLMRDVEGLGETAAIAIATSTNVLPNKTTVKSTKDLRRLCQSSEGVSSLRSFLLEHTDMPVTVRRWPKWRKAIVPRMLEQLSSTEQI
eukprot:scaffold1269_cov400-Prasinococcus_capsulatus_cf.AAC.2